MNTGARFSENRQHRAYLWRIWNEKKPLFMFIGLNPSTANGTTNDRTIAKLIRITNNNGGGGFYMLNLFTYISTEPEGLVNGMFHEKQDLEFISEWAKAVERIVFCWGNFKIAQERAALVMGMFDNSYCLVQNKNGSPKHPLYCLDKQEIISFDKTKLK